MADNPFQAPTFTSPSPVSMGSGDYYREGKAIVVRTGVTLPHRCVQCNKILGDDDQGKVVSKKLYYASQYIYLLLFLNILILIIVFMIVRKPVQVTYSIRSEHTRKKRNYGLASFASLIIAFVCFAGSSGPGPSLFPLLGILFIISFLVFLVLANRSVGARKHDSGNFWLQGFGTDFLDSIPSQS